MSQRGSESPRASAASSVSSANSSELLYHQLSLLEKRLRESEARLQVLETQAAQQAGRLSVIEQFFAGLRLLLAGLR